MADRSVFLVDCELSGESSPLRERGYAGAFVTCAILTADISEAIHQAKRMLNEDGYTISDIDRALRFEADDWADDVTMRQLVAEVRSTGEPAYSEFNAWGH